MLNFETALSIVKGGGKVGRKDWKNAKYVFLVDGSKFQINRAPLNKIFPDGTEVEYRPHIDCVGSDDSVGVWAPSMVDILSEDWYQIV
jgi:hypothetical protein